MEENSIMIRSVPQLVSAKSCTEDRFDEWKSTASGHIGILYVTDGFLNIRNEQKITILSSDSIYISFCGDKVRACADSRHTHSGRC